MFISATFTVLFPTFYIIIMVDVRISSQLLHHVYISMNNNKQLAPHETKIDLLKNPVSQKNNNLHLTTTRDVSSCSLLTPLPV